MEYLDQDFQANTSNQLASTRPMRQDWHTTARWANFLAIVWFIFTGIGLIGTLSIGTTLEQMAMLGVNPVFELLIAQKATLTVFALAVMGVYVALALYQYRFAKNMRQALQFNDQAALEASWLHFRNLFRWGGIFTIAVIIAYVGFIALMGTMLASAASGL